jgi:hypothetical protein
MDMRKHFAHQVIQNIVMRLVKVPTSAQLTVILTKGLNLQQSTMCVEGILGRSHAAHASGGSWDAGGPQLVRGPLSSRGGRVAKAIRVKQSHVGPKEGCVADLGAEARARHRLESESPGRPAAGGESVG